MITDWFKVSHRNIHKEILSDENADFAWSVSVGIFAIGGMIGGLLSGTLADKMGRKGALLFNNIFAFLAAAFMSLAKYTDYYYLFPLGRLVIGFSCGLSSGLVPMYLTEVSPINLRGTVGSVHQLLVTIAILFSQILGLPFLLGNAQRWPYIFGKQSFFSSFNINFSLYRSPMYLPIDHSPPLPRISQVQLDQQGKD